VDDGRAALDQRREASWRRAEDRVSQARSCRALPGPRQALQRRGSYCRLRSWQRVSRKPVRLPRGFRIRLDLHPIFPRSASRAPRLCRSSRQPVGQPRSGPARLRGDTALANPFENTSQLGARRRLGRKVNSPRVQNGQPYEPAFDGCSGPEGVPSSRTEYRRGLFAAALAALDAALKPRHLQAPHAPRLRERFGRQY
jgi:hypothetical protein